MVQQDAKQIDDLRKEIRKLKQNTKDLEGLGQDLSFAFCQIAEAFNEVIQDLHNAEKRRKALKNVAIKRETETEN